MSLATKSWVEALVASWMPRRAGKDNKEGHKHAGGEVLQAESTVDLTLTTSFQSFTGTGDSSKVRLLLGVGTWDVTTHCDFSVTVAGVGACLGALFVDDSGTEESEEAIYSPASTGRITAGQSWKVTVTADNTPIEIKAKKTVAAGTATALTAHTTLVALRATAGRGGSGAGSTGVTDHGALTGLTDDDHTPYALLAGRSGGQTLQGDTGASGDLTLDSTAHATKGDVIIANGSPLRINTEGGEIQDAAGSQRITLRATPGAGESNVELTGSVIANGALAASGDISPAQITADTNDYNPTGLSGASVVRVSSDAAWNITGLAGGGDGRLIYIINVGAFTLTLKSQSTSSTAANRFGFPTGTDMVLNTGNGIALWYDSTSSRWRRRWR